MPANLSFSEKVLNTMKFKKITESEIHEVFTTGSRDREHMITKQFSQYEIGLCYSRENGTYTLTSVWKRKLLSRD